ncbi:MAG: 50S ribosomal protein L9 [Candidatus Anammoxibacter sp.]
MKILLRKNIDKLGKIGEIVNVANGYARNCLLPKELAVYVTAGAIQQVEIEKRKADVIIKEENAVFSKLAEDLKGFSVTITAKSNEDGKLFGSISAQMISDTLKEEGFDVSANMIIIDEPIKQCDVYNVVVAISAEIKTKIKLWVVNENEGEKGGKDDTESAD